MNKKSETIQLPSLLSFERKLETADALMWAVNWGESPLKDSNPEKIPITKRQNRSTISAYKTKDDDKPNPNPVASDDANLPSDRDTLKVSFTLRIVGGIGSPFACNEPNFEAAIIEKTNAFKDKSLPILAKRYAYNIANGRFLWRNRIGAEKISINVKSKKLSDSLLFNGFDFSLNDFNRFDDSKLLNKLAEAIYNGLSSESNSESNSEFTLFNIDAYVKLGEGQHVFPSQEMNMNEKGNVNEKGKVLFELEDCAAMHNVKIGNAIRTIDDWYKHEGKDAKFPIAIEPFGAVTQKGQAYRKSEDDLYTLMLDWVKGEEVSDNNKTYVVGNLIRGGVFSGEKKKKKKNKKEG